MSKIKTWNERCEEHPDHQTGMVSNSMIQARMQEEIDELRAALAEPVLQTCNCRWDGETQVQQCTLHEAHVDAIHEWAERAKTAEKKLAALAEPQEPDSPERRCGGPGCDMKCCQPVQEPVAWLTPGQDLHLNNGEGFRFSDWTPLYTAPPQRPAEPLSEVDLRALYDRHAACQEEGPEISGWWDFARAVERAHGIGGEG